MLLHEYKNKIPSLKMGSDTYDAIRPSAQRDVGLDNGMFMVMPG